MKSIFSELPHGLIIDIIRIENDRKKEELLTKRKYNEVIKQINKFSTYSVCGFRSVGQKNAFLCARIVDRRIRDGRVNHIHRPFFILYTLG